MAIRVQDSPGVAGPDAAAPTGSPRPRLPKNLLRYSPAFVLTISLFSLAELIGAGRQAVRTVASNLPTPLNSTSLRVVDLVHPSSFGRVHDLTFAARSEAGPYPDGARLQVQLSSAGKTRLLVVRSGQLAPSDGAALRELVLGTAPLRIVADRGWVDLGPAPGPDGELRVQLAGLLPAPFGFAELNAAAADPVFSFIEVGQPDATQAPALSTPPRYRIVSPAPVAAGETLRRIFFFVSTSRLLQAAGFASVLLLAAGCFMLVKDRAAAAVSCLVSALVILHAVLLPPLQGADETSHVATIEKLAFGEIPPKPGAYPRSISLVAEALQMDRVQFHPEEPLPIDGPGKREPLRDLLEKKLDREALQTGPAPPEAYIQDIDVRASLFYRLFRILAPGIRASSLGDRLALYRLVSAGFGLGLFLAALALLRLARPSDSQVLVFGSIMLVPYMVGTMATCSNYAPAIGLGALLAAAALVVVLGSDRRSRAIAAGVFLAASFAGALLWLDFVFIGGMAAAVLAAAAVVALGRRATRSVGPRVVLAALTVAAALAGPAVGRLVARRISGLGSRIQERPSWGSASLNWMIASAVVPIVAALLLSWLVLRLGRASRERVRRRLAIVSAALGTLLAAAFLLTPRTEIPFETARLDFPGLIRAHLAAFWSNNFSFDQDRLSWKFYLGAFGWHDAPYPDWFYAAARWICVAGLIALPVLCARFVASRPRKSALLILASGAALSCCAVTQTLRYLEPSNPWGRFILPFLPLLLLPLAVQAVGESARPAAWLLVLLAAVHLWTPLFVLGHRYLVSS